MKQIKTVFGVGSSVAIALAWGRAGAQEPPKAADRAIELTVYKDDFAMVSEKRPLTLSIGRSRFVIDEISRQLDPNSVLFDWPGGKEHPNVVATTYNLGIGSGSSLLSRLNGQQVELMWPSNDGKAGEMITGRLEAAQEGGNFALRTADKLYVNPQGTIVAPASTGSTLPQLSVELNGHGAGSTQLGFSYLTRGMSWSADYVAKLNPHANTAEIECWATVTNTTGIPFPSARITLIAGSPNRMVLNTTPVGHVNGFMQANDGDMSGFTPARGRWAEVAIQKSNVARTTVGDLYAYKIPSQATIGLDQMNRVSVLGTRTVPIRRIYAVRIPTLTADGYYDIESGSLRRPRVRASVSVIFVNDQASNLGIPLPAGAVRVYEKDESGHETYTGASEIADTPRREYVSLTLSDAFDVYGNYRVVKSERIAKKKLRKTVEILLHNEKKTTTAIRVVQDFSNTWTLVAESLKSEKLDSGTAQWTASLKPGEDRKLTYTVEIRG